MGVSLAGREGERWEHLAGPVCLQYHRPPVWCAQHLLSLIHMYQKIKFVFVSAIYFSYVIKKYKKLKDNSTHDCVLSAVFHISSIDGINVTCDFPFTQRYPSSQLSSSSAVVGACVNIWVCPQSDSEQLLSLPHMPCMYTFIQSSL